jgi:hypothetical protein
MSQTRWADPFIDRSSPGNSARKEIEEDTAQAVIEAYTAAVTGLDGMRRRAFDAALRAYRTRHPAVPEAVARRQVAHVICFAGTTSAV